MLLPDEGEASAVRFDALMYGIELAYFVGKSYKFHGRDFAGRVE